MKSLWDVYKGMKAGAIPHSDLLLFPIGFAMAAIVGYLCIRFLMNYLQKHSTDMFVYYRWALAVLVAAVALFRG